MIPLRAQAFGLLAAAALPLAGCTVSAGTGSRAAGQRYIVNAERTQFYKYGPAQGSGPDFVLYKGQKLTMLAHQFGYSEVTTDDGKSGYVSNEDILPAPPEPKPSPALDDVFLKKNASRNSKPAGRRPTHAEESQVPLPELPDRKPPPDSPGFRY